MNSAFAYIIFHVSLEVSGLSTADIQAILAPLNGPYMLACEELMRQEPNQSTGSVRVSLATGEDQAVVEYHGDVGEEVKCQVTLRGTDGSLTRTKVGLQEYIVTEAPLLHGRMMGEGRMAQMTTCLGLLDM
jgi:hypothetical protein